MIAKIEKARRIISWIIGVAFLVLVIFSRTPSEGSLFYQILEIFGFIFVISATLGRIWCSIYICGRKDRELCQEGPYSIARNPLYLFSFLGLTGVMLLSQNLTLTAILASGYWIYYIYVIKAEEERLHQFFGQEFTDYCKRVNRLIPVSLKNYRTHKMIEINPTLLTRAMMDAGCFVWMLVLMEILESLKMMKIGGEYLLPVIWHFPY